MPLNINLKDISFLSSGLPSLNYNKRVTSHRLLLKKKQNYGIWSTSGHYFNYSPVNLKSMEMNKNNSKIVVQKHRLVVAQVIGRKVQRVQNMDSSI